MKNDEGQGLREEGRGDGDPVVIVLLKNIHRFDKNIYNSIKIDSFCFLVII